MGLIDKSRQIGHFMDVLESCDLGCAPSYEEPMGIAPLEYLRLGIPVVCTGVGGLIDVCEAAGPACLSLSKNANAEEFAAQLESFAQHPEWRQVMNRAAWNRKHHFTWERAVQELQVIWQAPPPLRPPGRDPQLQEAGSECVSGGAVANGKITPPIRQDAV
jgi:hypothetical protein